MECSGHDGQLPVMVRAMGLGAAGFARVPGAEDQGPPAKRQDGQPSVADELMRDGVSFTWEANDGSSMFAHWLQAHYNQGDDIDWGMAWLPNCAEYTQPAESLNIIGHIEDYILQNGPTAVSPYMFVAIGDDFKLPKPCLLTYADIWNQHIYGSNLTNGDVFVLSATFDHYVELVKAFSSKPANNRPLRVRRFEPTPYWTGFYASRPALKIMQEGTVRNALAAEALTVAMNSYSEHAPTLKHIWNKMTPSTHHDFITGTSPDNVYEGEQLVYSSEAFLSSWILVQTLMSQLSSRVVTSSPTELSFLIFNSLGNARTNVPVELPHTRDPSARSFFDGVAYHPIQYTSDGHTLAIVGEIQEMTYKVGKLSSKEAPYDSRLHLIADHNDLIFENEFIKVKISQSANYAATSIIDKTSGKELIQPTPNDPGAFTLEIKSDLGNIYRFENEMPGCSRGSDAPIWTPKAQSIDFSLVEAGPVRLTVVTRVNFTSSEEGGGGGEPTVITRKYSLYEHDKMLRVDIEGQAPDETSVYMRTPISFLQPMVSYGTPYHYDTHMPAAYWEGYNFMAIHNFVSLTSLEGLNIAFYTSVLRAWALDGLTVVTALFRNTPGRSCNHYGAHGSDFATHSVGLAFRIPSGLHAAPSLTPLVESLSYSTPLYVAPVTQHGPKTSNSSSIITISGDDAIITSLKPSEKDPSQIVARIYSAPASKGNPITFSLEAPGLIKNVKPITALENPLPAGEDSIKIVQFQGRQATFKMTAALATVLITPGW